MTIASQLLNTTLNPANLGGKSVEQARSLVLGAAAQAKTGNRIAFLEEQAKKNPSLAALATLLAKR